MDRIKNICNIIKMPEEAASLIYETIEKINHDEDFKEKINNIKDKFFNDADVDKELEILAEEKNISHNLLSLAFCLLCTDIMHDRYKEQGIGDDVYYDSLIDLTIWAKVCHRDYGEWGMKEFHWVSRALRGKLYRLGRLQFELIPYKFDTYSRGGYTVNKGDTVINVHIPEGGAMTSEMRLDSYKRAYKMFGLNVFVIESYLLYPKQFDFLPENSNILSLMREYDIIRHGEDDTMKDMWRIFGRREKFIPSELPRDTSLQRAYADHLAKTGKNGWGYGVMIFDGEKIVK